MQRVLRRWNPELKIRYREDRSTVLFRTIIKTTIIIIIKIIIITKTI